MGGVRRLTPIMTISDELQGPRLKDINVSAEDQENTTSFVKHLLKMMRKSRLSDGE